MSTNRNRPRISDLRATIARLEAEASQLRRECATLRQDLAHAHNAARSSSTLAEARLSHILTLEGNLRDLRSAAFKAPESKPAESSDRFGIALCGFGPKKISAIKALREMRPDLSLKLAKDMIEEVQEARSAAPAVILASDLPREAAERFAAKMTEAGCDVEIV